jgi:hypothetical protein
VGFFVAHSPRIHDDLPMTRRVPLIVKLAYTAFLAVLVPVYWYHYGPTNFLYFCDIALFFALAGVWLESPLLISMPAVGIFVTQMIWCADFVAQLMGTQVTGATAYMFHEHKPLYLRCLSSFHGWLPFLLIYLVARLGYDRRAFWLWTLMTWVVLGICYFFLPPPPAPPDNRNLPVNVNYVFGLTDDKPQQMMPPDLWYLGLHAFLPIVFFLPVHLVLSWWKGIGTSTGRRSSGLPSLQRT